MPSESDGGWRIDNSNRLFNAIISIMKGFVLKYLRFFVRVSLRFHKVKIIGITGSVGKSSTRDVIYSMMKDNFRVKVIKEGNSETGIPLGILGLSPGHYRVVDWLRAMVLAPFRINNIKNYDYLIIEMGIDSPYPPKNMDYLLTIVKPDISIVLNAYAVHSMQFDDLFKNESDEKKRLDFIVRRITKEKLKIITKAKPSAGIFNSSLVFQPGPIEGVKYIKFGEGDVDIKYTDYKTYEEGTEFAFKVGRRKLSILIKDYILPEAYREVFASTIAVGRFLGLSEETISNNISKNFILPAGRATVLKGIKSSLIVDSSYNSSRFSLITFIKLIKKIAFLKEKRPIVTLLGDMRELGRESRIEHEAVADELLKINIDQAFFIGPNMEKYVLPKIEGKVGVVKSFKNSKEAGKYLSSTLPENSVVLVKGSQNEIFLEEAVKYLLKDKKDEVKLCRQSSFWLSKKESYFRSL